MGLFGQPFLFTPLAPKIELMTKEAAQVVRV
jgi:hypothetical protein